MTFALRDYQHRTVDAISEAWQSHNAVMVELATGLGKTEVFTHIISQWEDGRALVVAPMNTLVSQAAKKIKQRTGIMPAIEQADNWSNESEWARNPFVVASKQTLCKKRKANAHFDYRYERFAQIGVVIVDECHLSITPPFKQMLDWFLEKGAKVLGVTATAKRHDKKALKNVYHNCAYQYGICEAVPDGWLVSAQTHCVQLESLDLSNVETVAGDFRRSQLDAALEDEKTIFEIADVTAKESENLKTAVFCSSVNEAKGVAEKLSDSYGKRAAWICADTKRCSPQRKKEVLDSFTDDPDGIQIVCNVGILTTGWDFPGLEHIVMARPTQSLSLFTQVFGRGTRPLPGVVDFEGSTPESRRQAIAESRKPHFKMTDLVDNSLSHKIITCADVLGGRMGVEVVDRAKSNLNKAGGPVDIEKALLDAKRQLEQEREEAERRRRAAVEASAKYRKVSVDPFDKSQRAGNVRRGRVARMVFGKHKGKPIADVPTGYLKWLMENAGLREGWLKNAVQKELRDRANPTEKVERKDQPRQKTLDEINSELMSF